MITFELPDVTHADELYAEQPAIQRHYLLLRDAMRVGDEHTVGDRQLRLLKGGVEIPITVEQCDRLLSKYAS